MKSLSQLLTLHTQNIVRKSVAQAIQPGFLEQMVFQQIRSSLIELLNTGLQAEATEILGRDRHQRRNFPEQPQRNGFKSVAIPGAFGLMSLLRPVIRTGTLDLPLLNKLRQSSQALIGSLARRFWLGGVSTRKTAEELREVFGAKVSASTVSQMTDVLESTVKEWKTQPVPTGLKFLFLDATYLPFRRQDFTRDHALLAAIGVDTTGGKHVLGYFLGDRENCDSWTALLEDLLQRGLNPNSLELVISDEHKAIVAAVAETLNVRHQLCVFHKMMNVRALVAAPSRKEFLADFKAIYWAETEMESKQAANRLQGKWIKTYPRAVETALRNYEAFTQFFRVEPSYWRAVRTTNLIERFNREIKRRVKNAGTLGSEFALEKLLYAVSTNQEMRWHKIRIKKSPGHSRSKIGGHPDTNQVEIDRLGVATRVPFSTISA